MDLTAFLLHQDHKPTDEELLEQIETDLAAQAPPSHIDDMQQKIANAYRTGAELAHKHGAQAFNEVIAKEKRAFVLGGIAGHVASGPNQEASPRSGFWRGAAGDIVGGNLGVLAARKIAPGNIGAHAAGALIGGVGGGVLAGRTARATPAELKAHAAKLKTLAEGSEKVAFLPVLGGAVARLAGGQAIKSMAGGMAKDLAKNVAIEKATGALTRPRQAVQQAPQVAQGFKYAGVMSSLGAAAKNFSSGGGPGTLGQKLVGGMVRNPGVALVGAGMVGGAVMAPRDPVTGEKQYLRGAATGAALGGGAYALGAGNKLRHAVVSPKGPQIFGEQAGAYARGATKATGPSAVRAAASQEARAVAGSTGGAVATHAAPAASAARRSAPSPAYSGGPTGGTPWVDPSMVSPLEFGQRSWGGKTIDMREAAPSQFVKKLASLLEKQKLADLTGRFDASDVRRIGTPPPIPAAAMRPKSPIAAGAGAALRSAPKPPPIPSLSRARALMR